MDQNRNLNYLLAVHGEAWAIERSRMRRYLNTLIITDLTQEEIEQRTGPTRCGMYDWDGKPLAASGARDRKAIAVLPLAGPIVHRAGVFSCFFCGTSTEKWGRAFDQLVDDPNVGAILIDVDSPGGVVDGVPELAEKIYNARGVKRIVAIANAWMASAAYWIASAADQIVITPSGELGSIGVWAAHVDQSGALEQAGLDVTLISAGPHKVEANQFEPLSEEAREEIQRDVNFYYQIFVRDVARHRGITRQKVEKDFGGGRMMRPGDAVKAGVADKIATLEQTIKRLGGRLVEDTAAAFEAAKREARLREAEAEVAEFGRIPGTSDNAAEGSMNIVADPMEILVDTDLAEKQAPYPNHHACELRPSGEFQKGSFRSVERKHDGKPYSVNMAKPKGSDKMADQSFRYKKGVWSPSEARKHCKDHGGRFEGAAGGESSDCGEQSSEAE